MVSNSLWINALSGLLALAVLVICSDHAVKRIVRLATYFSVSVTFMGMTILSVATTIPEISVHIVGSVNILRKALDYKIGSSIVLGSNIGSDVVQQTLILGIVVFAAGTLRFRRYFLWKSMMPMIGTTIMCLIFGWDRDYSRLDGFIFLATFVGYMYYLYVDERKYYRKEKEEEEKECPKNRREAIIDALVALVMIALTILSAQYVLQIAEKIVVKLGLGGSLVGVMTVGVATALPELTTAISGIRQKEYGICLGTLVGSNVTNPLLGIGGGAFISTYWAPIPLLYWDLPWEAGTGIILWIMLWLKKGKLGKGGALYLMALYFIYIIMRMFFFAVD